MVNYALTYQPYGNDAVLINWPQKIEPEILQSVLQFKRRIVNNLGEQIGYINHAYCSLLVKYDTSRNSFESFKEMLVEIDKLPYKASKVPSTHWEIPVCYDVKFGIDLDVISQKNNLTTEEIIQKHSDKKYLIYFIGFLPGFMYLGGLDESLQIPRRDNPRMQVPKGAIAIGGSQTGIYPQVSPGGWHIIGNTPINMFDTTEDNPCFARSGDRISFQSVGLDEYEHILNQVELNIFKLRPTAND